MLLVWSGLQLVLAVLFFGPQNSMAGRIYGTPPSFTEQPSDIVVHEALQEFNGSMVNLVLRCGVTGDPAPTVTWFRGNTDITGEGITPGDGSIGLNVTEGEAGGAARTGTLYQCRATNIIGVNNVTVTARSRNASVSYAFFGGFRDSPGQIMVRTRQGQSVALECAVNESNPPPEIDWWRVDRSNGQLTDLVPLTSLNIFVESVQNGRFLYFNSITADQINNFRYTCVVTNSLTDQRVPSGRIYTITEDLPDNELTTFILLDRTQEVSIGETLVLHISAAFGTNDVARRFSTLCVAQGGSGLPGDLFGISTRQVYTIPNPPNHTYIRCAGSAGGMFQFFTQLNLTIVRPPMILTSPPVELTRRDIIAGGPAVTLTCDSTGIPRPVITWFYNGLLFYSTMNGATVNNTQVTISNPAPGNSGVYQCFVTNGVSAPLTDIQRSYIVEITEPEAPTFTSLVSTNNLSVADRVEGTLLVQPRDTMDLTVTAEVSSNPCPSVQWQFNGINITAGDPLFTFSDPCSNEASVSPFLFNLTITNLTVATSGAYSAIFDNQGFSSPQRLPPLYVTIPVEQNPIGVSVKIRNNPGISCLLAGSTAVFTCDLIGFPRPTVDFFSASSLIAPATESRISNISFDQIEIVNIERNDQGSYNCRTTLNSVSLQSTNTQFSYCIRPTVVSVTSDMNKAEGQKLDIVCRVDGFPIPMVVWFKDDVRIQSQGNSIRISTTEDDMSSIVFISSASPANNGIYTCMAINDAGSVNGTIEIQVKEDFATNTEVTSACTQPPFIGLSVAEFVIAFIGVTIGYLLVFFSIGFFCGMRFSQRITKGKKTFQESPVNHLTHGPLYDDREITNTPSINLSQNVAYDIPSINLSQNVAYDTISKQVQNNVQ